MIKIKILEELPKDEIFNYVAKHLLTQKVKSEVLVDDGVTTPSTSCKYRGPDGTSCAIGCLISEDEYHSNMEDLSWGDLVDEKMVAPSPHYDMLVSLQNVHDSYPVEGWESELSMMALGLGIPISNEVKDLMQ